MRKNLILLFVLVLITGSYFVFAQTGTGQTPTQSTVCCEKTIQGAFCQNVPASECAPGVRQVPTACESTSYCKPGTCFDSNEGTCLDNTPQLVCNQNGGVWADGRPPQCELGCCILGDQASFVSLVRCKKLSASLGLQTNYDKTIKTELVCIAKVQAQDKGACVYEFEFEKTCKFTTRKECEGTTQRGVNNTISQSTFYKDKLCSAEELGTKCGPSTKTTCLPGKDEVFFVDTCGNPTNIYDSSKINDKEYWTNVKSKDESCNSGSGNSLSSSCGNCNYLQGGYCRSSEVVNKRATYGDFICADLNCKRTSNGNDYKHGESWCVYNDKGQKGKAKNSVGSGFFRHICISGEEVLEACDDYRAEECIEDKIGDFSQAACRVNRWQDCTSQNNKDDCENSDRRDCLWKPGARLSTGNRSASAENGACVPKNPPGLKFWESEEAKNICSQGNARCVVSFEKGIFGDEECIDNCECLEQSWEQQKTDLCSSLGDCGPNTNWIGKENRKKGFKITIGKIKVEKN